MPFILWLPRIHSNIKHCICSSCNQEVLPPIIVYITSWAFQLILFHLCFHLQTYICKEWFVMDRHLISSMNKAMCGHHFQYCNTWQRVTPLLSHGTHSCMKCAIIPSNDCLLYHQLNNTVVGPHFKQSNTVQHQHPGPVDPVNQYSQDQWVCWPD